MDQFTYQQGFDNACAELDKKTKPPGSLGYLETLAAQISAVTGSLKPSNTRARTLIFAADHGVAAHGVSAFPQSVTGQMLQNFASGGAAINALCQSVGADLEVIDTGVIGDPVEGVQNAKIAGSTASFAAGPAMTQAQYQRALQVGQNSLMRAVNDNVAYLALGEMGIANTTAAAAITAAICNVSASQCTGRGTGIDDQTLTHKTHLIDNALALHTNRDPAEILRCMGGFEIVAMAGAMMAANNQPIVLIVDGYIATAASLCACMIEPDCRNQLVFAHRSVEPGHELALSALNAQPLLDLQLRLGEGSGAALAIPLLRCAASIIREMATFEAAGVDNSLENQ